MAEYSRLASGQVVSTGGATNVILPFVPNFIEISNSTRATAASGVTRAWWETDMGQGAAFYVTTSAGPADGTSFVSAATGGGFSVLQAGTSLQYGPLYQHTGSTDFTIASTSATVTTVTCTTAHGLVTGNVVVFQNLYQTATTGMPQLCGIPFMVTKTGADTFTINWNASGGNYTTTDTATSTNNLGSWKQVLYPSLYAPGTAFISAVTTGATTTITTSAPHNFVVGQEVGFRIPSVWGTTQLNELPNVLIPGSPIYAFVTSVSSSTQFVVSVNSTGYTAFNPNQTVAAVSGLSFPQVVAVGDVNTGYGLNTIAPLYPSPTVYNGYSSSAVSTINGPAVAGAYINATFQGFVIGATVAGTASDVIYWRAYMSDINY